ncbi:MAG: hypothetical protein IKA72_04405 [Clostridia bacterium]|nr:hypothetical protein [Clostridia bacterium]
MKIDKVIVRTIVNTLCAIAILIISALLFASFIFPSTMMGISYKLGNDSGAMKYAYTSYSRTKEVVYIAYATEVAFGVDSDEDIVYYGEQFVADENFDDYCLQIDLQSETEQGAYRQYVYGRLVISEYSLNEKDKAFSYALDAIGDKFVKNNALVALLFESMVAGDGVTVDKVVSKMRELSSTLNGEDAVYLNSLLEAYDKSTSNN